MKLPLLPLIAVLALPTDVEANLFKNELTYKQIVSQCKGKGSKYEEYNQIGMTQFAKNYLKICLNNNMRQAWETKYKKCLNDHNEKYCYANTKID